MQHHITYYNISCIIRLLIVFEWKLSQLVKIASSEREREREFWSLVSQDIVIKNLAGECMTKMYKR